MPQDGSTCTTEPAPLKGGCFRWPWCTFITAQTLIWAKIFFAQKPSRRAELCYWKINPKIHFELDIFLKYRCFYALFWLSDFLCDSLQIARNTVSDYLIFQNFPGEHVAGPPSISRLWRSSIRAFDANTHPHTQKPAYVPGLYSGEFILSTQSTNTPADTAQYYTIWTIQYAYIE